MEIPVYLITGFLDSGKTKFINSILEDGFAREEKTLFLLCEEGETEVNDKALNNTELVYIEDKEDFNKNHLEELEIKYKPKQIVIELNGMWPLSLVGNDNLPNNWVLYQNMCFVEAKTFENYVKNMGQLMMEKIQAAGMIVFNRCTSEVAAQLRKRNLRMVNRRADIYLEDLNGKVDNYLTGNEEPFDMSKEVIEVPDDDFGIWYVDAMDNPDRYKGHKVHIKLQACHSKKYPEYYCPGRFVMVCCSQDIQFLGVAAVGEEWKNFNDRDWVDCTADIDVKVVPAYKGAGVVLKNAKLKKSEPAKNDIVSF